MDLFGYDNSGDGRLSDRSEVRVEVENLGPIRQGNIDLRPLTVFVGPSNTGKTYLAMSIYAMHKIFSGFPRFPVVSSYRYSMHDYSIHDDQFVRKDEYRTVVDKLRNDRRPFHFSDLPESVRTAATDALSNKNFLAASLSNELERCFDIERASSLIHASSELVGANLSLQVRDSNKQGWSFRMAVSNSGIDSSGHIDDVILLREKKSNLDPAYAMRFGPTRDLLMSSARLLIRNQRGKDDLSVLDFFEILEPLNYSMPETQSHIHYFPADRSGVMHSHQGHRELAH